MHPYADKPSRVFVSQAENFLCFLLLRWRMAPNAKPHPANHSTMTPLTIVETRFDHTFKRRNGRSLWRYES